MKSIAEDRKTKDRPDAFDGTGRDMEDCSEQIFGHAHHILYTGHYFYVLSHCACSVWNDFLQHVLYIDSGIYLVGFFSISIGLFVSSITESQVIAAVLTFLILFVSYMAEAIGGLIPSSAVASRLCFCVCVIIGALIVYVMTKNWWVSVILGIVGILVLLIVLVADQSIFEGAFEKVLASLSLTSHYSNFLSGIIDIPGIVYYLSGSFLFIFFTVQSVEKRRWC